MSTKKTALRELRNRLNNELRKAHIAQSNRKKLEKITLEIVADTAGINLDTISMLERGVGPKPKHQTLRKILDALQKRSNAVTQQDRENVFAEYGYSIHIGRPIPTQQEREQAVANWKRIQSELPCMLPAYVVDFTQRILYWNTFAFRIGGLSNEDAIKDAIPDVTLFDVAFAEEFSKINSLIKNDDEFYLALLTDIKTEYRGMEREDWYKSLIQNAHQYDKFRKYWYQIPDRSKRPRPKDLFGPLYIESSEGAFYFNMQTFPLDDERRFRVVQYFPVGLPTWYALKKWTDELENSKRI